MIQTHVLTFYLCVNNVFWYFLLPMLLNKLVPFTILVTGPQLLPLTSNLTRLQALSSTQQPRVPFCDITNSPSNPFGDGGHATVPSWVNTKRLGEICSSDGISDWSVRMEAENTDGECKRGILEAGSECGKTSELYAEMLRETHGCEPYLFCF